MANVKHIMSSSWGDDDEEMDFEASNMSYKNEPAGSTTNNVVNKDKEVSQNIPSSSSIPSASQPSTLHNSRDNIRGGGGYRGGHRGSHNDRNSAPRRDFNNAHVPLPTSAPFKLIFANVNYDATNKDIDELLFDYKVVRRININRGVMHVEFISLDELKKALAKLNDSDFMGRRIFVSVCPPPSNVNIINSSNAGNAANTSNRKAYNQNYAAEPRSSPITVKSTSPVQLLDLSVKIERKLNKPNPFGDAKPREEVLKERVTSQLLTSAISPKESPTAAAASESKETEQKVQETVVQETVVQETIVQESVLQETAVQEEVKAVQEKKEKSKKSKNKSGSTPKPKEMKHNRFGLLED